MFDITEFRSHQHRRLRAAAARAALAGVLFVGAAFTGAPPTALAVGEDQIAVTTTADTIDPGDGVTSLREAVLTASTLGVPTTIVLDADATYAISRCGESDDRANGDLDLTPTGPGAAMMSTTIEGNGATITTECVAERLIDVRGVQRVELRDLVLRGGKGLDRGGSLLAVEFDALTLERVSVLDTVTSSGRCASRCTAQAAVHAIDGATVALRDSEIADNSTEMSLCTSSCVAIGGLLSRADSTTLTRTVIAGNSGRLSTTCVGWCNAIGGALLEAGSGQIDGSSFADNVGEVPYCENCRSSGAVALVMPGGTSIHNSTIVDNTALGIDRVGGVDRIIGALTLVSSTLVDNLSETPEGWPDPRVDALNVASTGRGPITFVGTVVGSARGESGCSVSRANVTASHSFDSASYCGFPADRGNISGGGDPRLGPATGRLLRVVPLAGSPVIDAIPVEACSTPRDQIGLERPQGAACDMGAAEAITGASYFVAQPPVRLFDTRPGEPAAGPKGFVGAGTAVDVQVTGMANVPVGNVTAVVVNLTATAADGPGFVTAWPAGRPRPVASSINLTEAGQTRSNLVTLPIGTGGRVSLFASGGAHLLADVAGYYLTTPTATAGGRLVPQTPTRLFDTRPAEPASGPKGYVGDSDSITVQVTGRSGIPATGVSAVVLNVTATEAGAAGFVTAWPDDQPRPLTSIVNVNDVGDTASNLVIVPVGAGGGIRLSVSGGAHLLADVTAYITDDAAPESISGLFAPLSPARVFDTRPDEPAPGPKGLVAAGGTVRTAIGGTAGVPADAGAVVFNIAATQIDAPGFVTTWPVGPSRPLASTLNVTGGDTRSNAAIVPLGDGGELEHYTLSAAHLLADVSGYFLR